MDENAKKVGLIALIVVAVGALGFFAIRAGNSDKMDVVGEVIQAPPGFKSEKERALEAQAQGATPPVVERQEGDLADVGAGSVGTGGKR